MRTALDELEGLVHSAKNSSAAMEKAVDLIERKRRLSESISRRTRELKLTISIRDVDTFVGRFLSICTEELEDLPDRLDRISNRVRELAGMDDEDDA